MGCEREKVVILLRKIEREIRRVCRQGAEIVAIYRERLELYSEEEIEAELFQ